MVTVKAPATTANLGPGFDCLGAALSIPLYVTTGEGDPFPKRIQRAIEAAAGRQVDAVGRIESEIPVARGLGSSAACVAAGLLIGCVIADREPDPAELLRLGTPIEGHPDNLAPALYGGLTIVTPDVSAMRFDPTESIQPVVLVPSAQLKTSEARRVLTDTVARADALANVARASGLVALLTGTVEPTPDRLLECTDDLLHQPQRFPLMPETAEVIRRLRAQSIAAAVSGAGPSVVCLVMAGQEVEIPNGWHCVSSAWGTEGAQIL